MARNDQSSKDQKISEATTFVRKTLVSLLGQPADEAKIKAAATKVVRALPQGSRGT
jgi:hypothetical protein